MKHFWALPAFLRLAIASQHQFNVFDDVLAHPQVCLSCAGRKQIMIRISLTDNMCAVRGCDGGGRAV